MNKDTSRALTILTALGLDLSQPPPRNLPKPYRLYDGKQLTVGPPKGKKPTRAVYDAHKKESIAKFALYPLHSCLIRSLVFHKGYLNFSMALLEIECKRSPAVSYIYLNPGMHQEAIMIAMREVMQDMADRLYPGQKKIEVRAR